MFCTRKVAVDTFYVGASDRRLERFENLFPIPRGVSYNSYVILDDKTALLDTVDPSVSAQFWENVTHILGGRALDYLFINHMEPDHCSVLDEALRRYPELKLVGNRKTFTMVSQFFGIDVSSRAVEVVEGDELSLGSHTLNFITAPMVHWPEVMFTYDQKSKALFSADAFGTFGALCGNIFDDELDFDRDWLPDARRYYSNIVGKYGVQVQSALAKSAPLDIALICPLHGPVWRGNIAYILDKYRLWSSWAPEDKGVVVAYGSMYGHTKSVADALAALLADRGVKNIAVHDVSATDVSYVISDLFRFSHAVFASVTYNSALYPKMETLFVDMKALGIKGRTVALIENGTWAAAAAKNMNNILSEMKDMTVLDGGFSIKSAKLDDGNGELAALADSVAASL
ncbi:MAG: FprA family A-type flavoprotein [Oscillospiraceae bacterium]